MLLVKLTPSSTNSRLTVGIARSEASVWSSVLIRTMFGLRTAPCAPSPPPPASAASAQAPSTAPAATRRATLIASGPRR